MAYESCPFEVTPYDEANLIKTPNLVSLNYTNQDFWSMKARLIDYIKEQFADTFNDFVESDLAIMLIENWAFIADTLSFKMDQIANEIFIDTVSEVDNAFRLAMLVGFKPQPPIGAKSMWSATITNVLETDLLIGTPEVIDITTEQGPRTIELFPANSNMEPIFDEPIIISAGNFLTTNIVGVEGETTTDNALGTGEISQFIELEDGPVLANSVRVTVDGAEWELVDYFTDSQPRREFRVEYDPTYNAYVIFGNNRAGLIPSLGSQIEITYRVGGGTAGNIVTGSVEYQRNLPVPGFNYQVPVTFSNYTRGENGYEGDTIEDIKRKLPPWIRTQQRVVAGSDYEAFADQYTTDYNGSIGKSNAILRQHGCAANVVDLYILARDGTDGLSEASNELKVALSESLDEVKMITDFVCIKDGVVVAVDVTVDVTLDKFYRKFEEEFRERIDQRITSFYSLNNWDYGKTLRAVDLIKALSDIREIRTVDINFETEEEANSGEVVTTKYYEIIRPSSYEINFVYE
jgi:hypothetical protein